MVNTSAAFGFVETGMQANGGATAMLAGVTGPEEAAIALAGGADIIHLTNGTFAAMLPEAIAATLALVAGRRRVTAAFGPAPMEPDMSATHARTLAAAGVDGIMVPVSIIDWDAERIGEMAADALPARLFAVLFADREQDLLSSIPHLAEAGFQGLMLDLADRSGGRLVARADVAALSAVVATARENGLLIGLAGSLEAPDIPRLLALRPDFLGFRSALCVAEDPSSGIDLSAVQAIRALIPRENADGQSELDDSLPAARARLELGSRDITDRVFVHDFVLPVRIGAYKHEHDAPQNVRFDVAVEVHRARGAAHGMAQVFSYDILTDGIRAIVAEGHIDLVESLADRIDALALRHKRAKRITVRVEKLEMGPGGVGVEIVIERPGTEAAVQALLAALEESAPRRRP